MPAYFLLTSTTGCEQVNNSTVTEEIHKTPTYTGKPSAPITFTHNYDGTSYLGDTENISLVFSAGISGEILISIISKDGIISEGDITLAKNVTANEKVIIPMTLSLPEEGRYYLSINTSITENGSTQSKSFALAISTPQAKKLKNETNSLDKTKRNIIIMDAEEKIIQE